MGRERRRALAALCAGVGLALGAPAGASAAAPIFQGTCPTRGDLEICSGQVPSFDGTSLDVDLTKPQQRTGGRHPLIVMLHGYGNNKHEWESRTDEGDGADKYHWNSHWFATHGFYVLTYTARGFRDPGPDREDQPDTPGGSSARPESGVRASIHLKDRETEIHDTQWLAALVARSFADVDRGAVAVTGGSYGGGESWLQASQAAWTFPHETDPTLPVLDLQVAVPKYPWTDLAYSLAPNGHPGPWRADGGGDVRPAGYCDVDPSLEDDPCYSSAQGDPDDPANVNPFGVVKSDYVQVFYSYAYTYGGTPPFFNAADQSNCDLPGSSADAWYDRSMVVGEPYDGPGGSGDPLVEQQRQGLTECRSSYYQDEGWKAQAAGPRRVAVFSIQGWTDDLFTAVESFRQFKYLKALNPRWPVAVALADVGHPRAGNPPATWRGLNAAAWQWVRAHINGSHDQQTGVASYETTCDAPGGDARPGPDSLVVGRTPEDLSSGALVVRYARGGATTSKSPDPNGPATDPVGDFAVGQVVPRPGNCPSSPGPAPYTAVSEPLDRARTYVGLGSVTVPYQLTGAVAQLDARVWDVPPSRDGADHAQGGLECEQSPLPEGCPRLLSRGAYRLDVAMGDPLAGELRIPLFGNHFRLAPGHRLRLDVTQLDGPYMRPSNVDSAITFAPPTLTLPTRSAGTTTLAGS